jgi:hypothetical protein
MQQALHFAASRTVNNNDKALPPSGVEFHTPLRRKAFVPKPLRVFSAVSLVGVAFFAHFADFFMDMIAHEHDPS